MHQAFQLPPEVAALEREVGGAAFPDTFESVLERVRADLPNADDETVRAKAVDRWSSRLSMLKIIKERDPGLFAKMERGD